jgi:hypothetical protein
MDETAESQQQFAFHLTGARPTGDLEPIEAGTLRSALLAGYRDLASLRYDFPVVLVESPADGAFACSLMSVVDDVLQEVAPRGVDGERVRRGVLRLEREIRALVADGARGMLTDLWDRAACAVDGDEDAERIEASARARLKVDGELADCDHQLPGRLVAHAWRSVQREKAARFHAEVNRLVQALSDILRAAFIHSEAGRRPESLQAAFGHAHHDQFDFETMSRLLGKRAPKDELSAGRRERIEWALGALRRQRFFEPSSGTGLAQTSEPPFEYCYGSCADAVDAFRERLPEVVEFVKAMSIAELEADGRYVASEHDAFFEDFDEGSLGREDLALFPDYLVCVDAADADESAAVIQLLASDLPVKVLVQSEEVLEESSPREGHFSFGIHSAQLAGTAIGLHDVFVLQTTSSNLYQVRSRLLDGLQYAGAALVSVFSGSSAPSGDLPPYLTAAAAMEGRAFPAFTYDPVAGPDLASRFSLEENPQPELDWPLAKLEYADASLQRMTEQLAFTLVDFAVCDRRYARHFARIPRERWNANTVSVEQWLSLDPAAADGRVPHVLVVDESDSLHRLIVDAKLMQAARRCLELWHGLQEMARLSVETAPVAEAPAEAATEAPADADAEAATEAPADADVEPPAEAQAEPPEDGAEEQEHASDEPWIETVRCSTCNECTAINDRMFAYNENKQAFIKDPDAGTFRELVEAAETCQVAIIHPGKPRNPSEPGLEELIEQALPFQ